MREAAAAGAAGAVLAGATGALVGLAVPAALVGGLNGAISGARRVYGWRTPKGIAAFVLDSKFVQKLGSVFHRGPVGLTSHDDPHQWSRFIAIHFCRATPV